MRRPIVAAVVLVGLAAVLVVMLAGGAYLAYTRQADERAKKLQAVDPDAQIAAIEKIAKEDAKTAVPKLVRLLATPNEDVRLNAALALGEIDEPAIPALRDALADPDKSVRFYTVWALGLAGPTAKSATPEVIKALGDMDAEVRYKAAFTLGRIGVDSDAAVAALIGAFRDADDSVREEARAALAQLGSHSIGRLCRALPDPKFVRAAATAIAAMGRSDNIATITGKPAEDLLEAALKDGDDDVRTLAAEKLRFSR